MNRVLDARYLYGFSSGTLFAIDTDNCPVLYDDDDFMLYMADDDIYPLFAKTNNPEMLIGLFSPKEAGNFLLAHSKNGDRFTTLGDIHLNKYLFGATILGKTK